MAIGTTAAILGASAIAGGATILGAKSQSKAASKASNAEVAMARENNAMAREFYNRNTQNLSPWMQSGARANSLVDSFLYGPAPTDYYSGGQPAPQPAPSPAPQNAMMMEESSGLRQMLPYWKTGGDQPQQQPGILGRMLPYRMVPESPQPGQVTTQAPQQNPMSGYNAFVNSPYYQFPLQEGYRGLNHNYAARGMLESGDAMKAITRYGQDYGYGRMGEFIGLAQSQSDQGLRAGSAIAGVGLNALNAQTNNNNNIGASRAARYAAQGNASANMYAGIGSILGNAIGDLAGPRSSYGYYSRYRQG